MRLLDLYRKPDGSAWGGQDLERATGGAVTRSYISNLKKGRIGSPGLDKLGAIAKAMGFPPALWCEDSNAAGIELTEGDDFAARVEHLFRVVKSPGTGEPYTDTQVARMSGGGLSEDDVKNIRTGKAPDPTVGQARALAGALGVPPCYLLDQNEPLLLDEEAMVALRDETAKDILREAARLPEREKRIVLGIVRQFEVQLGNRLDPPDGG